MGELQFPTLISLQGELTESSRDGYGVRLRFLILDISFPDGLCPRGFESHSSQFFFGCPFFASSKDKNSFWIENRAGNQCSLFNVPVSGVKTQGPKGRRALWYFTSRTKVAVYSGLSCGWKKGMRQCLKRTLK